MLGGATSSASRLAEPDDLGAVYTPLALARWVAAELLRVAPERSSTVVDLACGEGALLAAVAEHDDALALVGSDVDRPALERATRALSTARFSELDVVAAATQGGEPLRQRLGVQGGLSLILNPPWGIDLARTPAELRNAGLALAQGQFDSADLFVEIAVELLEDGEAGAFIIPDSLFFPERAPLRRLLVEECTLERVARLGEGFFPGIFRGTAVVVLRRGAPASRHLVSCFRLAAGDRKAVLAGAASLDQVSKACAHDVPQRRFASSSGYQLSIDLRESDLRHVEVVERQPATWTRTLLSGRGVELSKHGQVVRCGSCGHAWPRPRKPRILECVCGRSEHTSEMPAETIVRPAAGEPAEGWQPLVAGEDVGRYACLPQRQIRVGVPGINYKRPATPDRRRLLVRKTGIGLKAALFDQEAYTTQTVFHYAETEDSPPFMLAFALGALASRVLLAVHLKRTGENEWRSHPYVSQTVLRELPIPAPEPESWEWRQARAIGEKAAARRSDASAGDAHDLEIEGLVAGLYGLTASDLDWVHRVLADAQGLEGVASLRLTDERVEPIRVG